MNPRRGRVYLQHALAPAADPEKEKAAKAETVRRTVEFQMKRAAEGWPGAQYELGLRYLKGDGVEQNPTLARLWLQAAAEQGDSRAVKNLKELADAPGSARQ